MNKLSLIVQSFSDSQVDKRTLFDLAALSIDDPQFLSDILHQYLSEGKYSLTKMQQQKNQKELRSIAHSWKGRATVLGFKKTAQVAHELQCALDSQSNFTIIQQIILELDKTFGDDHNLINTLLDDVARN